jgi:hypothetical protein
MTVTKMTKMKAVAAVKIKDLISILERRENNDNVIKNENNKY